MWYLYLLFSLIIGIWWFTSHSGGNISSAPFMMFLQDFFQFLHSWGISSSVSEPIWFTLFLWSLIMAINTSFIFLLSWEWGVLRTSHKQIQWHGILMYSRLQIKAWGSGYSWLVIYPATPDVNMYKLGGPGGAFLHSPLLGMSLACHLKYSNSNVILSYICIFLLHDVVLIYNQSHKIK